MYTSTRAAASALLLATVALLAPARAAAQAAPAGEIAEHVRALATVSAAIDAMGGRSELQRITTIERRMVGARSDPGQAGELGVPDRTPVIQVSARTSSPARSAEYVDLRVRGGLRLELRTVTDGRDAFTLIYPNRTVNQVPAARAQAILQSVLRRHPESLLMAVANRPFSARWVARRPCGGQISDVVNYADADGAFLYLCFDPATHLLSSVARVGDDPVRGDVMVEARYVDYRQFGAVRLPTRYVDVLGSDTVSDMRVEIRLNDQVPDTLFTRPAGFADAPAAPTQPTLQPLGGGAWAVLGSYNSAFVVLDSFVVVLEAPLSPGNSDAVLAFIRQVAPGKPVRYVVATHFHYDHLGGIRPFVAAGATILTTPTAASVIRRLVRQPHVLRPDALSRAPREPIIEEVTRARTLGAGEHRVEIEPLGRMPHVDEILMVYVPQAKLLFEGDLFDAYAGDQFPGTDDSVRLVEWIAAHRVAVDHLLPVHGVMSDVAQLRRAVDRRSETARR